MTTMLAASFFAGRLGLGLCLGLVAAEPVLNPAPPPAETESMPPGPSAGPDPSQARTEFELDYPFADATLVGHHGRAMVQQLSFHAQTARRDRLVAGGIGLGLSSAQVGLGVYGLVGLDQTGRGLRQAAIAQTAVGGLGFITSTLLISRRAPLERIVASANYRRLQANPWDLEAQAALRLDWKYAAQKARKTRLTMGGLNIAVGVALTSAASVRLAAIHGDSSSPERVWAYMTLTSAIGLTLAGVTATVSPTESERSFGAHEASHPSTPPHAWVKVRPRLGGATIMGQF